MPRFLLLAVDLDGTLLDAHRRIPEANRLALERASRSGVKLAIVTGRRLPAALPSLRALALDPYLVINSGALIKEGLYGRLIRRELLSLDSARQVIDIGLEAGMDGVIHDGPDGEGYLVIGKSATVDDALDFYLNRAVPAPRWVPDLSDALDRDPVQVMFAGTIERVRLLFAAIQERLGTRVSLARTEYPDRNVALLDVLAPLARKAEALRFLAERCAITREHIMAIGDNWNDVEMLESAGLAVVMGNAVPELRERGFAVTATNEEAGVALAIDRFLW